MKDGPDNKVLPPEMWKEEHALNTQYVRGCFRESDEDEGAYEREFGYRLKSIQNKLEW